MHEKTHPLEQMARRLARWEWLGDSDRDAVLSLPSSIRRLPRASYVVREGDNAADCAILLRGYATSHKIMPDGSRQIQAVHLPGDFVDLHSALLPTRGCNVQVLTESELAMIPVDAVRELAFARPAVGLALWRETLVDGSIQREWSANLGRRSARERTSHFLCEWGCRVEAAGLGDRASYHLPMTQDDLADALGLTAVHMNRTLMGLDREGLITRQRASVVIKDWSTLVRISGFDPVYLHLGPDNALLAAKGRDWKIYRQWDP